VDSGFTVPPIEIAGGYIWIIQVAEIVMGDTCNTPPKIRAYVEYHRDRDLAGVKAKVWERRALLDALESKRRGEIDFDVAIVDGEVLTRYGEEEYAMVPSEAREVMKQARELTERALVASCEVNTPIVGVLKRSYSGDIRFTYGLFDIGLNDRAIASIMLKRGEYFVLGTYREIEEKITREYSSIEPDPRISSRIDWIRRVTSSYGEHVGRVKVVFYKPRLNTVELAVKTEIAEAPEWSIGEIVSALSKITGNTGFPIPLDYVDSLAYIRPEIRRLVYELVYSKLSQKDINIARLLSSLVNPQKPI